MITESQGKSSFASSVLSVIQREETLQLKSIWKAELGKYCQFELFALLNKWTLKAISPGPKIGGEATASLDNSSSPQHFAFWLWAVWLRHKKSCPYLIELPTEANLRGTTFLRKLSGYLLSVSWSPSSCWTGWQKPARRGRRGSDGRLREWAKPGTQWSQLVLFIHSYHHYESHPALAGSTRKIKEAIPFGTAFLCPNTQSLTLSLPRPLQQNLFRWWTMENNVQNMSGYMQENHPWVTSRQTNGHLPSSLLLMSIPYECKYLGSSLQTRVKIIQIHVNKNIISSISETERTHQTLPRIQRQIRQNLPLCCNKGSAGNNFHSVS